MFDGDGVRASSGGRKWKGGKRLHLHVKTIVEALPFHLTQRLSMCVSLSVRVCVCAIK